MIVYKITNLLNKKVYIGKTSKTLGSFDRYWGSGLLIRKAVKKYGINNFGKVILLKNINDFEASDAEKRIIGQSNCLVPFGYNLAEGGNGGNLGPLVNKKISKKRRERDWTYHHTEESKRKCGKFKMAIAFAESVS